MRWSAGGPERGLGNERFLLLEITPTDQGERDEDAHKGYCRARPAAKGAVSSGWVRLDELSFLQQLGAMPSPAGASA
ncbi:MAG: hypothetical protein HW413_2674 [Thermoleophilia bacterium]|nr:hypothetical protein [Thermoleophilia bacterium]